MSMPMQRKRDQKEQEKPPSILITEHHVHTWKEFLAEAKRAGFKLGLLEDYSGKGLQKDGKCIKEEVILFSRENGVIVYAYTFSGRTANYARIYGELQRKNRTMTEIQRRATNKFNHWQQKEDVIAFAMDVRQGIETPIQNLSNLFGFSTPWKVHQEMQFVNTVERDGANGQKREIITQEKLNRCNPVIREILGI